MTPWQCALWGLFGGAAVEGLEIGAAIRRCGGRWPWNRRKGPHPLPLLTSIAIRLGVGAGLAAAAATAQPLPALGAMGIGVAAPLIIEKLAGQAIASSAPTSAPASGSGGITHGRQERPEVQDAY